MSDLDLAVKPGIRVAVIGTGTMGAAIAGRLIRAGMEVNVWSRRWASMGSLAGLGATAYETAPDAVGDADIVISTLPTGDVTSEVMLGDLTLKSMKRGAIWVQMATIGVEETDWFVAQTLVRRPDVIFVDAPVSGSRGPAETGQLLILASGPRQASDRLRDVFDVLGRKTMWLGPAGAGSRMKLVLNTWLAFQTEGAAEAAAVADHLGVSKAALVSALSDNPLASQYALSKLARMIDQDYHADFSLDWALKDLDLVASISGPGVAPIADDIADRWRNLVNSGSSGLDVSAARKGLEPPTPTGSTPRAAARAA